MFSFNVGERSFGSSKKSFKNFVTLIFLEISIIYLFLFDMFGIVKAKHPLVISRIVGIRKVYSQRSSIRYPMMLDPQTAPKRPDMSDKQSAIALKF
jgi:hypothetical protein